MKMTGGGKKKGRIGAKRDNWRFQNVERSWPSSPSGKDHFGYVQNSMLILLFLQYTVNIMQILCSILSS